MLWDAVIGWCWLVFLGAGGGQSVPITQPAAEASGNFQNALLTNDKAFQAYLD